ncbi:hypothetical protein [Mannheimia indoligenes]|uniref:hypothetical protein n=1 Tax=Mannheimia indoligenes TaxID=3103145 RepID=UPI002FE6764C
MRKCLIAIIFLMGLPFIYFGVISGIVHIQSIKYQPEFRKRADFLISCINDYRKKNGSYPKEENCVSDLVIKSHEMVNSPNLIGRGDFIFYTMHGGPPILIVGHWYPPNLIYDFDTNTYEENSRLFLDSGL